MVVLCSGLFQSRSSLAEDGKGIPLQIKGFATRTTPDGVLVMDSGQKVLFFQRKPKSLDGKFERAGYVHPLWDLDGNVLTEDFPEDHKHHRGIFWTWHQLSVGGKRVGDPWLCKDFLSDVRSVTPTIRDDGTAQIDVLSHWKSPLWKDDAGFQKTIVEERTAIVVHPIQRETRAIDFSISLKALEKDVRIGGSEDVKGYGGFCMRLRLPDGLKFRLKSGGVEPQRTSVDKSPWLDMTAAFSGDSKLSGVSLLTHPSTPGFPQRWILRQKRSMQNPVFPGRESVAVPEDKPLRFSYRVVLHSGEVMAQTVDGWQSKFEKTD
jgi:hypothetical protein